MIKQNRKKLKCLKAQRFGNLTSKTKVQLSNYIPCEEENFVLKHELKCSE